MGGDVEMNHSPPIMGQDDKDKQNSKADRRYDEEIRRDQILQVIVKEGAPSLMRGRPLLANHVLANRRLGDIDSEFQQLAVDPRSSPERICHAHFLDQLPYFLINGRVPRLAPSTLPSPVKTKASAMPANNRFRFDN